MKKAIILFLLIIITTYLLINIFKADNLSRQFEKLSDVDFNILGITRNGVEYKYIYGTEEFDKLYYALINLFQSLQLLHFETVKRGEAEVATVISIYNDDIRLYKLFFGYAPKRNLLVIQIFNKNNFSITKHFSIDKKIVNNFFNITEVQR
jgi:hypothetical protein